ncbi:MAG: hypothetical protein RI949_3173, partial [Pseudomonadota bacterium]
MIFVKCSPVWLQWLPAFLFQIFKLPRMNRPTEHRHDAQH